MATTTQRRRAKRPRGEVRELREVGGESASWYKDAIIYQLHVRAFADANADGIGDFRGLTQRLDYIRDLGVTAIWLLPFYPSPLRDDGYDIADYTSINPSYGTLRDFKRFLQEARDRDLRVITELVLNHTSDEHKWFQKSRRASPGSKWRDFYVWSDNPRKYQDARIIFRDFESSNWAWDPVANAYFWHRFYSHQPDLNYENPAVREAMFHVLDFWLEMGVDGFRLDAVPYLFEREGTTCENLPETHDFLRELRAYVDAHHEDKLLLAEANQWPEDAAAYFGQGDECHMNFHFPLMPRLFMSVQREDRFPVVDILQQTPAIPETCQWATFLRNHDELTLEMVTDEERDYMYRTYAEDPTARINLGIRRRLAPLLKNNRREIELLNAVLMSLPGTPVVYYGDEIGMGDNIYLGDRDGVRTPMQWNGDRNAGFSEASQQRLYLPVITEAEYHYSACNVENQHNSRHSLLWWMRRIIHLRKQHTVFGRGELEFLSPDNSKILAYLRRHQDETVLIVANLSRFVQAVELDLQQFSGRIPVEMTGQNRLPAIQSSPYVLTLGPHAFYWLRLDPPAGSGMEVSAEDLPTLTLSTGCEELFVGRARARVERLLPKYMVKHRWFAGKARQIRSAAFSDIVPITRHEDGNTVYAALVEVQYVEGEGELYLLPLSCAGGWRGAAILEQTPQRAVAWLEVKGQTEKWLLYESVDDAVFWKELGNGIARRKSYSGGKGEVIGSSIREFRKQLREGDLPTPTVHGGQQSNTSGFFGDRFILKLFRRVSAGVNPDLEIGRFLTQKASLTHVPAVAGSVEYQSDGKEPMTLAVLQQYEPNEGDAWEYTLDELGRYYERVLEEPGSPGHRELPGDSLLALSQQEVPELARAVIGGFLTSARLLGQRTAELHAALAADQEDPAFAPEPFTSFYQRSLYQSLRTQAKQVLQMLRKASGRLPEQLHPAAQEVLGREAALIERFRQLMSAKISALRIRLHGDYHLGQVLFTGKDFVIIDFEGEPDRPLSERKIKASPLRDVAGMLRSLDYAANSLLMGQVPGVAIEEEQRPAAEPWVRMWYIWSAAAFLKGYLETPGSSTFLPAEPSETERLLQAYVLHKLIYELGYELNNRPDWTGIPLRAMLRLVPAE